MWLTIKKEPIGSFFIAYIEFYIFTVVRNAGIEDKKKLIISNEAENFIREITENQDDSEF